MKWLKKLLGWDEPQPVTASPKTSAHDIAPPLANEACRTPVPLPPDPLEYLLKEGWKEEPTPEESSIRLFYKIDVPGARVFTDELRLKTKRRALRHFYGRQVVKHRAVNKTNDSIELRFHRRSGDPTKVTWRREPKADNPLNALL